MPEINFTIDPQTGEMEMKVEGVQGPQMMQDLEYR